MRFMTARILGMDRARRRCGAGAAQPVTYYRDIAPHPAAQLPELPPAGRGRRQCR